MEIMAAVLMLVDSDMNAFLLFAIVLGFLLVCGVTFIIFEED
jgi:hypothetical protein